MLEDAGFLDFADDKNKNTDLFKKSNSSLDPKNSFDSSNSGTEKKIKDLKNIQSINGIKKDSITELEEG